MSEPVPGIRIHDAGDRRVVETDAGARHESTYSPGLLRLLAGVRGPDLVDELRRVDDPGYLRGHLLSLLAHFNAEPEAPLLDFGCGLGASSILVAEAGFRDVLAVDIRPDWIAVAGERAAEHETAGRLTFRGIPASPPYDLPDAVFGTVVLNAVLEHVPRELRGDILRELWRVLLPGGRLLLRETPNALWPYDSHFTALPFVFWLPPRLRAAYARRFSRRCRRDESLSSLVSRGLTPPTYFELARALPGAECLNCAKGGDAAFYFGQSAGPRRMLGGAMRLVEPIVRSFGLPAAAFFPYLALGFRKPD